LIVKLSLRPGREEASFKITLTYEYFSTVMNSNYWPENTFVKDFESRVPRGSTDHKRRQIRETHRRVNRNNSRSQIREKSPSNRKPIKQNSQITSKRINNKSQQSTSSTNQPLLQPTAHAAGSASNQSTQQVSCSCFLQSTQTCPPQSTHCYPSSLNQPYPNHTLALPVAQPVTVYRHQLPHITTASNVNPQTGIITQNLIQNNSVGRNAVAAGSDRQIQAVYQPTPSAFPKNSSREFSIAVR